MISVPGFTPRFQCQDPHLLQEGRHLLHFLSPVQRSSYQDQWKVCILLSVYELCLPHLAEILFRTNQTALKWPKIDEEH